MSAKTLDQYTPEERAQMIGMWAEWHRGDEPMVLVVIEEINPDREFAGCTVPGVRYVEIPRHRLTSLTPRFDLLRAWTPDGKPVEMEPQESEVDYGWIYHGDTERTRLPDGARVRRFVTDWEEQA